MTIAAWTVTRMLRVWLHGVKQIGKVAIHFTLNYAAKKPSRCNSCRFSTLRVIIVNFSRMIKMDFSIKAWRRYYNAVQCMGKMLQDSYPTYNKNRKLIPPIAELSKEEKKDLQKGIINLINKSNAYLDSCGIKPRQPLWRYNKYDPQTWPSHKSFIYGNLLKVKK